MDQKDDVGVDDDNYSIGTFDSHDTHYFGEVWCWSPCPYRCQCNFHKELRSSGFNFSLFTQKLRHYRDGPIHNVLAPDNTCQSCRRILERIHRFQNGIYCDCWLCQDRFDDDSLTDSDGESTIDETIE
jgi:hypothetical protein